MFSRIREAPVYDSVEVHVDAPRFNQVRLALLRLSNPLRLELDGLGRMDMMLDEEGWLCVDRGMDDRPVVAWVDFQVRGRDNLHRPILCRRLHFHREAESMAEQALDIMDELIGDGLKAIAIDRSGLSGR